MRVGYSSNQSNRDRDKKKKKKDKSTLEKEIFSIMEKSLKTALDAALDDILKDWKYLKMRRAVPAIIKPKQGRSSGRLAAFFCFLP